MIFLIDLENVSNSGFDGLETLTKADELIIFYSNASNSISISTHCNLEKSPVLKTYFEVKNGTKNALDFQLVTYLGYLIANNKSEKYFIISNDTGYDCVSSFWHTKNVSITRFRNLNRISVPNLNEQVKKILPDNTSDHSKIIGIINKYKTKQGINNALVKEFGSDKAGSIYKLIKPLLKDKSGN